MTKRIEPLKSLQRERFYGNVRIEFQAGDIDLVRKQQTFKPESTRTQSNDHSHQQ